MDARHLPDRRQYLAAAGSGCGPAETSRRPCRGDADHGADPWPRLPGLHLDVDPARLQWRLVAVGGQPAGGRCVCAVRRVRQCPRAVTARDAAGAAMIYVWLKALHVAAVLCWSGGLLAAAVTIAAHTTKA